MNGGGDPRAGIGCPFAGTAKGVLHIAVQARRARADDGALPYRSKPESFQSQAYAIDTSSFSAEYANAYGFETSYRPGSLMFGTEYYVNNTKAPDAGDPVFHGGEVFAAYILTGEVKPYNAPGLFRAGVAGAIGLRGRSWRLGGRNARFVQRHGQPVDPRREVLAVHADGQLAHVRQRAARAGLRLQLARPPRGRGAASRRKSRTEPDQRAIVGERATVRSRSIGGCTDSAVNCIPITPGWNYLVRMYRPRKQILDGTWTFPEAAPLA